MLDADLLDVRNATACLPVGDSGLLHAQSVSSGHLGAEVFDDLFDFHVLKMVRVLRAEYNCCDAI